MTSKTQLIKDHATSQPDATQDEIAAATGVDQSYVSRVLEKMRDIEIESDLGFKLTPPEEPQPKKGPEYQCGACGTILRSATRPRICKRCGIEFE